VPARRSPSLAPVLLLATAVVGALCSAPPAAASDRLLAASTATSAWLLRADREGVRVVDSAGGVEALPLPPGAGIAAFMATSDGWVAAATVPRVDGTEINLWQRSGTTSRQLPAVPARAASLRHAPVPLLAGGKLVGLAWLEGESLGRLAVRAAAWTGSWEEPSLVAAQAPGSQLALAGAVLADGSWLLAWSAFDGDDDEVVWSRRGAAGWTPPAPLPAGGGVPDVTPALRADRRGAVLVWSRFVDGEYRLMTSRLEGKRWSPPLAVGTPGTIFPSWEGDTLLFRDARHGAWVAGRLSGDGIIPQTALAAPADPRPALLLDGETPRMLLPERLPARPRVD
jgi:hypothetical protein